MKVLVQNYTHALSTEPLYFNAALNQTKIVSSHMWNNTAISAFDALDQVSPDVLICHFMMPQINDVFKYAANNKKLEVVINVTGINHQNALVLQDILEKNKIQCPFLIYNHHEIISKLKNLKMKVANILPGADIFLSPSNTPDFQIDAAILTSSSKTELFNEQLSKYKTWHTFYLAIKNEKDEFYFDMDVNLMMLKSLYHKYNEFVIVDDLSIIFTQLFFDSSLNSKKVVIKNNDFEKLNSILASLFHDTGDSLPIDRLIKEQIKKHHTCLNRTAKLLRELNNMEASQKIQDIIETL